MALMMLALTACAKGYYTDFSSTTKQYTYQELPDGLDDEGLDDEDWDDEDWDDEDWDDDDWDDDDGEWDPAAYESWGFGNSGFNKITGSKDLYLSAKDNKRLQMNLSNTELALLNKYIQQGWNGSAYGMSITSMLLNDEYLEKDELGLPNFDEISDYGKANKNVISMLNYYQVQQALPEIQNCAIDFQKKNAKAQLEALEDMVATGYPVLIGLQWWDNAVYGHAVVGYAFEELDKNVVINNDKNVVYTKKISIYDPDYPNGGVDSNGLERALYFNDNGNWYYSGRKNGSALYSNSSDFSKMKNNNAKFWCCIVNPDYLDMVNYKSGDTGYEYDNMSSDSADMAAIICPIGGYDIKASGGSASVDGIMVSNTSFRQGDFLVSTASIAGSDNEVSNLIYYLPQKQSSYQITSNQPLDVLFNVGNVALNVVSDQAGTLKFTNKGEISVEHNSKPGKCTIEITANGKTPFGIKKCNTIKLEQRGSKNIYIKPTTEGLLVEGTDFSNVILSGNIDGKEIKLNIGESKAKKLLLTIENDVLLVKSDDNGNGKYDSIKASKALRKGACTIILKDKTATYTGSTINIDAAIVAGTNGKVTYKYYSDAKCKNKVTSHKKVGTYYVKASVKDDFGTVVESNIAKLVIDHKHVIEKVEVKPTCYSEGKVESICSICKKVLAGETLKALPHNIETRIIKDSTCIAEGTKELRCTNPGCTYKYTKKIKKKNHDKYLSPIVVKEATCLKEGIIDYNCNKCGVVNHTEYTDKLAHKFDSNKQPERVVKKSGPAAHNSEAYHKEFCTLCKKYQEVPHNMKLVHIANTSFDAYVCESESGSCLTCSYAMPCSYKTTKYEYKINPISSSRLEFSIRITQECTNCHSVRRDTYAIKMDSLAEESTVAGIVKTTFMQMLPFMIGKMSAFLSTEDHSTEDHFKELEKLTEDFDKDKAVKDFGKVLEALFKESINSNTSGVMNDYAIMDMSPELMAQMIILCAGGNYEKFETEEGKCSGGCVFTVTEVWHRLMPLNGGRFEYQLNTIEECSTCKAKKSGTFAVHTTKPTKDNANYLGAGLMSIVDVFMGDLKAVGIKLVPVIGTMDLAIDVVNAVFDYDNSCKIDNADVPFKKVEAKDATVMASAIAACSTGSEIQYNDSKAKTTVRISANAPNESFERANYENCYYYNGD
ncbi:MAG: hypothetical protein MJ131_08420 [Lachnospiraceae bacterium]|nr:hypothetical protein [Lachnospiraceae bacterium]